MSDSDADLLDAMSGLGCLLPLTALGAARIHAVLAATLAGIDLPIACEVKQLSSRGDAAPGHDSDLGRTDRCQGHLPSPTRKGTG